METTLSTSEAADILFNDKNANWSYNGSIALVEHLEGYEESPGEELKFDYVAIRCDFSEYASLQEWAHNYFGEEYIDALAINITSSYDAMRDKIRDYINDHGELIEFDGGVIVSSF